jgi:hypothetical protein
MKTGCLSQKPKKSVRSGFFGLPKIGGFDFSKLCGILEKKYVKIRPRDMNLRETDNKNLAPSNLQSSWKFKRCE